MHLLCNLQSLGQALSLAVFCVSFMVWSRFQDPLQYSGISLQRRKGFLTELNGEIL